MENLKLDANEYLPLRDVVFKTLREAILRGDLKPGERLMELQLAAKLGVSRTEVAAMTEKDMEDVLQVREALEILAVQLASEKITKEQIAELEERLKAFEQAVETAEVKQIAPSDIDFHDLIYTAAENPRLVVLLNNLREQIYRYRVEYLKDEKNYPRLIEEHRQIMQGLKERNEQYVVEMTKKHMDNQAVAVRNIIRQQE